MARQKIAKILAPTVPLVLEVDEGEHKLELKLAWTMRGVILLETRMRLQGREVNILQDPSLFWTTMDATTLATAVWAMSQQENPEYCDESGFEVIASFIVTENQGLAASALKECFLESLSKKRRDDIRAAEAEAQKAVEAGVAPESVPVPPYASPGPIVTALGLWAFARYDLGLSDEEFGDLSYELFDALVRRKEEEDRARWIHTGTLAAAIINTGFNRPEDSVHVEDFVPGAGAEPYDMSKMPPEEAAAHLMSSFSKRTVTKRNG